MGFLFVVRINANSNERAQDDADGNGDRQLAHPLLANRRGLTTKEDIAQPFHTMSLESSPKSASVRARPVATRYLQELYFTMGA